MTQQQWEYKAIHRTRGAGKDASGAWWAAPWDVPWATLEERLAQLGAQGWELVAIVPGADMVTGSGADMQRDFTGFTTSQTWVFKRPKS
jgi:hypothetical protein